MAVLSSDESATTRLPWWIDYT